MSVNVGNIFSAEALSRRMIGALPANDSPQLRTPYDAIALLAHATMLAAGFRLIGLGEDHKIDASADIENPAPLPAAWNASSSSDYAFRYAHSQSSLHYLIKISRLGPKAVINGLGVGDDKVHTLDLLIKDFISESSLPFNLPRDVPSTEQTAESTVDPTDNFAITAARSLRNTFISAGRLTDAATLIKLQIIQKLAPGIRKEGYEESAHAASPSTSASSSTQPPPRPELPSPAVPRPYGDPLAAPPRRPIPQGDFPPPGFEDEYDITRPPGHGIGPGRRPLNIGERDLYPAGMGPNDPFGGGAGAGFGGLGGVGGGGGMHPTFDDPLFQGQGLRGSGMDPRVPPGARYDPLGPGDGPPGANRGGPRGGGGFGGFGGGGPPNPFGGFGGNDFI